MRKEPLAYRMRPEKIEDIVGQDHIIGKDKPLYRLIKSDKITSIILWGPPGCGKTTIAEVIAKTTDYRFVKLNAVTSGIADVKRVIEDNENMLLNPKGVSIVFIDEIHRFNKAQQDVLLPFVEKGDIILIGSTTENPYFEINKALISRSMVFKLNALNTDDIIKVLKRSIESEKGYKSYDLKIEDGVLEKIAILSNGDIRSALNSLEITIESSDISNDGYIYVNKKNVSEIFPERKQFFDKKADEHYDVASAMIKSIRGSNPDAAIHYLAKLLEGGEDVSFIARRLIISASEDIGLANPNALNVAVSGMNAVKMVGMPEARIILAEVIIYLALSKKSNTAYIAINNAISDIKNIDTGEVPYHLRNATTSGTKQIGYGKGYKYPHDYKDGKVEQQYMPEKIKNRKYYIDKWGNDIFD